MIKVVKFYHPVMLSPGQTESWILEDTIQSAKFVFQPMFRLYTPAIPDSCHLKIVHILDLGFGDDPLWSGTDDYVVVDEDVPPDSMRDYVFAVQLDKATPPAPVTRHVVYLTNLSTTTAYVFKTLLFGLTDTQIQTNNNGVITTIR